MPYFNIDAQYQLDFSFAIKARNDEEAEEKAQALLNNLLDKDFMKAVTRLEEYAETSQDVVVTDWYAQET